jgi:hypothetical protein
MRINQAVRVRLDLLSFTCCWIFKTLLELHAFIHVEKVLMQYAYHAFDIVYGVFDVSQDLIHEESLCNVYISFRAHSLLYVALGLRFDYDRKNLFETNMDIIRYIWFIIRVQIHYIIKSWRLIHRQFPLQKVWNLLPDNFTQHDCKSCLKNWCMNVTNLWRKHKTYLQVKIFRIYIKYKIRKR